MRGAQAGPGRGARPGVMHTGVRRQPQTLSRARESHALIFSVFFAPTRRAALPAPTPSLPHLLALDIDRKSRGRLEDVAFKDDAAVGAQFCVRCKGGGRGVSACFSSQVVPRGGRPTPIWFVSDRNLRRVRALRLIRGGTDGAADASPTAAGLSWRGTPPLVCALCIRLRREPPAFSTPSRNRPPRAPAVNDRPPTLHEMKGPGSRAPLVTKGDSVKLRPVTLERDIVFFGLVVQRFHCVRTASI
jgi:hypothetical protein